MSEVQQPIAALTVTTADILMILGQKDVEL